MIDYKDSALVPFEHGLRLRTVTDPWNLLGQYFGFQLTCDNVCSSLGFGQLWVIITAATLGIAGFISGGLLIDSSFGCYCP